MIVLCLIFLLIFNFGAIPIILLSMIAEKNIEKKKICCILFTVAVSLLLYNLYPSITMDLAKYYDKINYFRTIGFNTFLDLFGDKSEILSNLLFYVISLTNNNHYLMVFQTILSYSILFYIVFDYRKSNECSNLDFNIVLLFLISSFNIVYNITPVRFFGGRLIFFLALYRDIIKNKRNILTIILYIIPFFIHKSLIVLPIIRLILLFNKNKFDYKMLLFFVFLGINQNILLSIIGDSNALSTLSGSANTYLLTESNYILSNSSTTWIFQIIVESIMLIIIYLLKRDIRKNKRTDKNNLDIFMNYELIMILISFLFTNSFTITNRFAFIATSFFPIILLEYLKSRKGKNKIFIYLLLLGICFAYFVYQIQQLLIVGEYNNLISLKTTILGTFILFFIFVSYFIFNKIKRGVDN